MNDKKEAGEIGNLALALSKTQGAMGSATKNKKNPHLRSTYADLASVWDACREPLSDNGLAIIQTLSGSFENMYLTTILAHESGQSIKSEVPIKIGILSKDGKVSKLDMQGMGSAITYARRYALAAMVGVYQDDNDGNPPKQNLTTINKKQIEELTQICRGFSLRGKEVYELISRTLNAEIRQMEIINAGDFEIVKKAIINLGEKKET